MKTSFTLIFLLCISTLTLRAQDANYWQSNYGTGGLLTPGAVIAYDNDKGLFYYNPALMAINPKSAVTVSSNIYQLSRMSINDGIGSGKKLKNTNYRINSQMVAGTISFKKNKTFALGYALIHDPIINYQATQRREEPVAVLSDNYSPGKEYYVGQYTGLNRVNLTTGVGTASVKLNSHWSAGLTAEVRLRNQDKLDQYSSTALINTTDPNGPIGPFTNVEVSYQASYWHLGLRLKAGVAYNSGIHHLGMLVSLPSITLKSNATVTSSLLVSNLHDPDIATAPEINIFGNTRQTSLPVTYKIPWSIAAGYAVDIDRWQFRIEGEYFWAVPNYDLIKLETTSFVKSNTGPTGDDDYSFLTFREQRRTVTNWALGASYYINPQATLIASVRQDLNYVSDDDSPDGKFGQSPTTSRWDNYHLQFGGNFRRNKSNLRAGLLLTYGSNKTFLQPVNFDNPNEDNVLLGDIKFVKGSYFSIGLMLCYVYNL
ncbi:MAG: hypothetical protein WC756_01755 [Taibaiella sp.]|jgi:hypothetical protein